MKNELPPAKTEPAADIRQMAAMYWEIYTAFIDNGFTPPQALYLCGVMLNPQ